MTDRAPQLEQPHAPNTAEQWFQVANRMRDAGRLADAIQAYSHALKLDPNYAPAYINLGTVHAMKSDWPQAIAAYRQALLFAPNMALLHFNLGNACESNSQWDAALAAHQRAAELSPNDAMMCHSLGVSQFNAGLRLEAIVTLRRAISLRPDDATFHWSLANALLAMGLWEEGWREFEWRLAAPHAKLNRGFLQPQWDGTPAHGKTLLLHAEGGHGDGLQFIRYVPLAAASGATLILECHPALLDLFRQVQGVSQIIPRGQALPHFDLHIPLLGMARLCSTTEKTIPTKSPYLNAPADRVEKMRPKLPRSAGLKVGLVWAGRPMNNDARSRSLETFAPLARIRGVQFFSLQKGAESSQKPPEGMNLIDLTAQIADFADAAGLLAHLDLLITVDTAAAHLAGAMGKPVWVLIPHCSDFRWLLDRDDSPWYPSMRLFRQGRDSDWQKPIHRIAEALQAIA